MNVIEESNALQATPLSGSALGTLARLLESEHLPAADLHETGQYFYRLDRGDGRSVGYLGLAVFGPDALLRSVIVSPTERGQGNGRRLIAWSVNQAAELGAERLYLLTIGAAGFFGKLGFATIERASAPHAIAQTREFTGLCPASAVLMVRSVCRP